MTNKAFYEHPIDIPLPALYTVPTMSAIFFLFATVAIASMLVRQIQTQRVRVRVRNRRK
jgi:hypothetical protein